MVALSVEGVSVNFDKVKALDNVSFEVSKGEIFIIMGLSGCGKSTLLRTINHLVPPCTGKITAYSNYNQTYKEVTALDKKELISYRRRDVSMVFQNYGLLPHLSVIDNTILGLKIRKYKKKEAYEMAMDYIKLVKLEDWMHEPVYKLSGGMKQRVGIARALVNRAPLLLMDEPFSGLDPINRHELSLELLNIREQLGVSIIFVTHTLSEAILLGDNAVIMDKGVIIQRGTPGQISSEPETDYVAKFIKSSKMER